MFSGSYSDFRKEGRSVKNEDLSRDDAKQEYRHKKFVTTFKEDRPAVVAKFAQLAATGVYPTPLYEKR